MGCALVTTRPSLAAAAAVRPLRCAAWPGERRSSHRCLVLRRPCLLREILSELLSGFTRPCVLPSGSPCLQSLQAPSTLGVGRPLSTPANSHNTSSRLLGSLLLFSSRDLRRVQEMGGALLTLSRRSNYVINCDVSFDSTRRRPPGARSFFVHKLFASASSRVGIPVFALSLLAHHRDLFDVCIDCLTNPSLCLHFELISGWTRTLICSIVLNI